MYDPDALRLALARRLRSLRIEAGLTQIELAERAGISNEFLSRIEHASGTPSLDTVARLAHGLGLQLCEVFQEDAPADVMARLGTLLARLEPEDVELILALAEQVAKHRRAAPESRPLRNGRKRH